jgi:hypothetical protein
MAIDFVNVTIISRAEGGIAIALAAYIRCERWTHEADGRRNSAGLRTCAPSAVTIKALADLDPLDGTISRAALRATTSIWRLYGLAPNVPSHQGNAALTRHAIVSLPKELPASEMRQLAIDWAKSIRRERTVNAIFRH